MLDILVLGGLAYLFFKDEKADTGSVSGDSSGTSGRSEPAEDTPIPQPIAPEGDDYRTDVVDQGEQNPISLLEQRTGLQYDNNTSTMKWVPVGYLRGSKAKGFVRASAAVGGTISFECEGQYYESVLVYATIEEAKEADKKPVDDGSGPQKQPEAPEDDGGDSNGGGVPLQPGFGFGGVSTVTATETETETADSEEIKIEEIDVWQTFNNRRSWNRRFNL